MQQGADIIIIGGGVIGASIAYHLAKEKTGRIVLLERRALGNGTTGRSGAIVRQHYSNEFTIRMAKESLDVFEHFDDLVGGDCGFVRTGLLVVSGEQGTEALRANVVLQQQQGVDTKLISLQEVATIAPGHSIVGAALACYEVDAGIADPIATTYCFAQQAQAYGAIIHEGVVATHILTQGERVTGVATSHGDFLAATVILAANAWSTALAKTIGTDLPITATRHPMLVLRRPNDFGGRQGMHAVCFDTKQDIYLRPDIGGMTLVGSSANVSTPSDPDNYAQGLSEEEIAYFQTKGAKRIPALARAVPRGNWAGIYDDTPDFHPILGRIPAYEGLYCAAGFSGHGFKLSPSVGKWMMQLISTGSGPADMQHFAYERFSQGKEIRLQYTSGVLG